MSDNPLVHEAYRALNEACLAKAVHLHRQHPDCMKSEWEVQMRETRVLDVLHLYGELLEYITVQVRPHFAEWYSFSIKHLGEGLCWVTITKKIG